MSRSKKGAKPCGYEYWGRRAISRSSYGKDVKVCTNKIERRRAKQALGQGKDVRTSKSAPY